MDEQTHTNTVPPTPPVVLSGQELYDHIMRQIEPELCSEHLEQLKSLYASQTPEQRTVFSKKYKKAFAEYERRLAEYQRQWNEALRAYKRHAIAYIEHQSAESETSELDVLASSIDQ